MSFRASGEGAAPTGLIPYTVTLWLNVCGLGRPSGLRVASSSLVPSDIRIAPIIPVYLHIQEFESMPAIVTSTVVGLIHGAFPDLAL